MKNPTKYDVFPSLRIYDQLKVPYVVTDSNWSGPLWTGHCMILSTWDGYGDEGFMHELLHWVVATPEQRQYPDLQLGRQINAGGNTLATSTSDAFITPKHEPVQTKRTKTHNPGWGEQPIPVEEANKQEELSCNAMWFYHQLVGLASWNPATAEHRSEIADDFNGQAGYANLFKTPTELRETFDRVIRPFKTGVTWRKFETYALALRDLSTE